MAVKKSGSARKAAPKKPMSGADKKQAYQKIYEPVTKGQGAADRLTAGKIAKKRKK